MKHNCLLEKEGSLKSIAPKKCHLPYLIFIFLFLGMSNTYAQSCTVNAGLDQTICENQALQLDGNSSGSFSSTPVWSQIGGPSVIISDTGIASPTVSGYSGGNTYMFQYAAVCQNGTEPKETVTITVNSITTASTSADITSCPDSSGAITVTGNSPGAGETGTWSVVGSNNAGVTINFPGSTTTTLNLAETSAGTTTLRWTLANASSSCTSTSDVLITNSGGVDPVYAGADETLSQCYTATQNTSLSASFGGSNVGGQQGTWVFVTGPSTPTIADINNNSTGISDLIEGTYTFRWDVSGPCVNGSDTVDIIVLAATQDVTTATVQDDNQRFCDASITSTTLVGSLPDFTNETVLWEQIDSQPPVTIVDPTNPTTQVTGMTSPNSYQFRYTITNTSTLCTTSDTGRVRFNSNPISITVNSGNDIVGVCDQTSFDVPLVYTNGNRTEYSLISGPSGSALSFPTSYQNIRNDLITTINVFDAPGVYTVNFRRRRLGDLLTACDEATDAIVITVSLTPTGASAGSNQTLVCGGTTTALAGSTVTTGSSVWSQVSGPNTATIADIYAQNTGTSGLVPGLYTFRYSVSAGANCPVNTSDTEVFVSGNIGLTDANAGPDQTAVCVNAPVQLAANTPGEDQVGTWSGPAGITFSDINDPNAIATGFNTASTTYSLQWAIQNSTINCGTSSDTMDITTTTDASPIVSNAGADQCLPSGTTMVTLAGNDPPVGQQGTWTVTPAAGVTFGTATQFDTTATVPSDGVYTFTWTIDFTTSNGCPPTFDDVEVTIANTAAAVSAGLDQSVCLDPATVPVPLSFTMAAGTPPSPGVGTWILVSGNGGYTVDNINSPTATFSDLLDGTYVFQWRIDYGNCAFATDEVTINVGIPPTTANIPGGNQVICGGNSTTITADPLANPSTESGVWTLLSGAPNTPTIDDPSSNSINVTGLETGSYTFRWTTTGSSPLCTSSEADVVVDVYAAATAGADQNLCQATSVFLEATGGTTGTWSIVSTTNPLGIAGFTPVQSPVNSNTANAPVDPGFEYVFEYTTDYTGTGSGCNNSSQVTITVSNGPTVDPNAGPDQNICNADTTTATLAGNTAPGDVTDARWSFIAVPSMSSAIITTDTDPFTTVTGLTVPGIYILQWNFESSFCTDKADIVRIQVYEAPTPIEAGPDQLTACQLDAQLAATAPTIGIGIWSFAIPSDDPSGVAVIDSPNNPQTTLSNIPDDVGNDGLDDVYVLTWTVSNGPFASGLCAPQSDTVTLTFTGAPPSIGDAGADQELCDDTQTNLNAVPVTVGVGTWTQTAGPAANIASVNNPNSLVFGLVQGTYEFTWTTNGGGCSYVDTMEVTVLSQPITAEAGPNQTIVEFSNLTLGADDPTPFTGTWTQLSGPNTASILSPTSFNSQVAGTTVGTYIFEWTVSNGICSSVSDTVQIEVIGISDLELTKSVSPTSAKAGEAVLFTIDVFNNNASGSTDATGVSVQDFIPSGYTLVSGTVGNGGVYNAGNFSITWSNLSITSGNTVSLTFQATVNATGNYNNTAQIIAADQFDPDSTVNNNISTEDDQSTVTVTVLPNDPPVADDDASLGNTIGNLVQVLILNGDTDIDGTIEPATVTLTIPLGATNIITDLDGDVIGFTTTEGTWSYNDTTGLLGFDPVDGFTGNPVDITYTVDDNDGNTSNAANVNIEYTPVAPVANNDVNTLATAIGADTVINIINNDTLPDGSTPLPSDVTVDLDPGTAGLQLTLNVPGEGDWTYDPLTGEVTFSPEALFTGDPAAITYELTDIDTGLSDTATVTVDYQAIPVAVDDSSLANTIGAIVSIDITGNDTDADGNTTIDVASVTLTAPIGATDTVTDTDGDVVGFTTTEGTWSYNDTTGLLGFDPADGFTGDPVDITYTVDDNDGNTSNLANVNIGYTPVAPVATDDVNTLATAIGADTVINIINNDALPDGSTPLPSDVTVDLDPGTAGLQLALNVPGEGDWTYDPLTGEVTFSPEALFTGDPAAITYGLTDLDTGLSDTATVTVDYQAIPVAVDDASLANTIGTIVSIDITGNDTDADGNTTIDVASVTLTTPIGATDTVTDTDGDVVGFTTTEGTWSYNDTTGLLGFDPADGFTGDPADITYTVDDNDGNTSNLANVNIGYTPVAPIATDDANTLATAIGADTVINIINNDTLPDGTAPLPSDVTVDLDLGTAGLQLTLNVPGEGDWTYDPLTGELTFAPVLGFTGDPAAVTYEQTDLDTGLSDTAVVTVDYQAIPVAVDDASLANTIGAVVSIDITDNDTDADGNTTIDVASVTLTTPIGATDTVTDTDGDVVGFTTTEGTWSYNDTTGLLGFDPADGFTGNPVDITYTVDDNDGNTSNAANVNIGYTPVAPVANNDANTLATAIGADTVINIINNDTLPDGSTPLPSDVTVDLDPGTAGVQLTLNVPGEGDWTYGPLTGELTFAPVLGFTGDPAAITYEQTDLDTGLSDTATVTVDYQAIPVAVDDASLANTIGAVVSIDITGNDTDADGNATIDAASVSLTAPGTATDIITDLDGDLIGFTTTEGAWSYNDTTGLLGFDPADGFTGNPVDITYTVDDNDGNTSNAANVNIGYTPVAPVATDDVSANNVTNNPVILDVLANDTLADGTTPLPIDVVVDLTVPAGASLPIIGASANTIGFMVVGEGTWLYDEGTGEITFTPEGGFTADPTPIDYNILDIDNGLTSIVPATMNIDYAVQLPIAQADESLNNIPNMNTDIAILNNDSDPDGSLDPDGVNLIPPVGATNIITDADGDVIAFDIVGEGTWSYDPATGILTFDPLAGFITDPTPVSYTVDDNDGNPSNPVSVMVDYVDVADLSLIKTVVDNDTTPFTDTEITFEIQVTNDGPANASGVVVEDLLPSGYDFILYSSTTGVYDENSGIWNVGNIASGATETLLIDVLVNETGAYLNEAEVTASDILDIDSTPNNNVLAEDDQDEVNVVPQLTPRIDLSVTKMADSMTPDVGGLIVFTMTVTNDGPSDATSVVVTDLLANGYEYQSSTVTVGSYQPLNGSWTVGNLANGITQTMTITAMVLENGDYTNKVEVTDALENDIDSTPANNDDTEDDQQTIEPVPVSVSDLALTKTVNNATPNVGDIVQFDMLVENLGLSDARGIEVTDLLPSGYTFVSSEATAGTYSSTTGIWNITRTMVQGDIERLSISAMVNPTGDYNNIAAITASDNTDFDIANNTDNAATTPVAIANLSLNKVVDNLNPDVTDQVTFTLTLRNDGPSEATGIVVTDPIPSGFNWVTDTSVGTYNATTGLWTIAGLASGAVATIDITVSINTTGSYINIAEVTSVNELDPNSTPNNGDIAEDDMDEVQVFPRVITDIEVTKSADNLNPSVGSQITFIITATNNGPSDATGIVVEDMLASGYQFVSVTTTIGVYDDTIGSWNVGNLANGMTETMTITVVVLPTGNYNNTAELIALNTFDPDSNPDNNIDSEDDQETVNPRPTGLADLSIVKLVDNADPLVGDMVEFTINTTNSGDSDATGVVVTDLLPAGYTFISYIATAGIYNSNTGIWSLNSTLFNGNTESLIILAEVNNPSGTVDEYINNAQITASDQTDPDSEPGSGFGVDDYGDGITDDDEASVVVTPQTVDIAIDKTVDIPNADIDNEVVFTIMTTNNSTTLNATNVRIEDQLPQGYAFISASTTSGSYDEGTGLWSIPTVAANTTETLTMTVRILDTNDYVNIASLFDLDQSDIDSTNNSSEAFVEPQCLSVFNEFSPNGDGVNEFFTIDCISRFPNNRLEIYNRWGNIVYEANGYNNDWDGVSNGRATVNPDKRLPVGTYYYILDLGDGSEPKAGWLYINR